MIDNIIIETRVISDDFITKDADHIKNSIPKGIPIVHYECDRYSWYFRDSLLTYNDDSCK